jgi:hypothetical protein
MSRAGGEVQRLVFGASVSMCVCYVGAPTKSLTFFILIKQISLLSWRLKICHHIICALEPSLVPTPDVKSSRPRRGWHRPPLSCGATPLAVDPCPPEPCAADGAPLLLPLDLFKRWVGSRLDRRLFSMVRARPMSSVGLGWPVPPYKMCEVGFLSDRVGFFLFWVGLSGWEGF